MADADEMLARLKSLLPSRWFGDETPVLDALLGGLSDSLASVHELYAYAKDQTRIATASGFNLDLIAWDFLGGRLLRRQSQSDDSFRAGIIKEIFRPRATRPAMKQALKDLTGADPIIFEPANPVDTGTWNGLMAWSVAGRWGSLERPFECWIDCQRPLGQGIPGVEGWGEEAGGWNLHRMEWVSLRMLAGPVTDAEIYALVETIKPAATICWTRISDQIPPEFLQPGYSFLATPDGDRLVLDDHSGIIVDGPPVVPADFEPGQAPIPPEPGRLWFDHRARSAEIAVVLRF